MEKKGLWRITLCVGEQFYIDFCGQKVLTENGVGFIESNTEKKITELPCIALYSQQKKVLIKIGVITLMLDIEQGNIDDFVGDYRLLFLGKAGLLKIEQA